MITAEEKEKIMEMNREEKILYLRKTVEELCEKVKNSMLGPYTALQMPPETPAYNDLKEVSIESLEWLCHKYLPKILMEVYKITNDIKTK